MDPSSGQLSIFRRYCVYPEGNQTRSVCCPKVQYPTYKLRENLLLMKRLPFSKVAAWLAFAFSATPFSFAQEVSVSTTPRGMVLISGGEFLMGAVMPGHGSGEMPMPTNDAAPIHPVFVEA